MRHITLRTLNEYEVADEYFVIYEQDVPMYVFTVLEETTDIVDGEVQDITQKYLLQTPVVDVVENLFTYSESDIDMLRMQSKLAAEHAIAEAKQKMDADAQMAKITGDHYYG